MLGSLKKQALDEKASALSSNADVQSLIPWFKAAALSAEEETTTDVRIKLRGNILHALCQSSQLDLVREDVLMRLVRSLMQPEVRARFETEFPQVHQIYIYSRRIQESKPAWSAPVYLNRLDTQLERLVAAIDPEAIGSEAVNPEAIGSEAVDPEAIGSEAIGSESVQKQAAASAEIPILPLRATVSELNTTSESNVAELSQAELEPLAPSASASQTSDLILARKGDSAAIARYLSEALGALNVGVKVNARVVPGKAKRSTAIKHPINAPDSAGMVDADENEADREKVSTEAVAEAVAAEAVTGEVSETASPLQASSLQANPLQASPAQANPAQTRAEATAEQTTAEKPALVSRLWIFCEASYSPDPLLIAEPIAQRLRQLHLRQFQDAVITIQVTGEAASDWRLRVDLTPPEDMLREWGRWGDLPALSLLVNHVARRYGLKLVTETKKDTLHLISYVLRDAAGQLEQRFIQLDDSVDARSASEGESEAARINVHSATIHPATISQNAISQTNVNQLVSELSDMLRAIAPQGIHRVMLYGPSTDDISPEWLRGIDLPAADTPDLQSPALDLAKEGDLPALAYCLTRALNPDITEQLSTGGIRVQLLLKENLLHIMADGPVCPPKNAIVPLINQTLAEAEIASIAEGVRLYGRRAGQKQPIWTHGKDYQSRQRMVPEAKPEFAASEAYIGELIAPVSDSSLATTDAAAAGEDVRLSHMLVRGLQYALLKSQAFIPADDPNGLRTAKTSSLPKVFQAQSKRMALIWGAVGLFLAVQFDFLVGQALQQTSAPLVERTAQAERSQGSAADKNAIAVEKVRPNGFGEELAELGWNEETVGDRRLETGRLETGETEGFFASAGEGGFAGGSFTASEETTHELTYSPQQGFVSTESLLASSNIPSFRSQQLDEKLALYRRRVAQSGPPDVLIIGSSRALRGVDPAALRQALGSTGYEGLSFFNFGVNGATAQVVDLIVRRLIPPDQLPQIIVWADGARAFNSGRDDMTFEAIASSEGYQQLEATDTPDGVNDLAIGSLSDQLAQRAQTADRQLSEFFGKVSSGFTNRNKIRTALSQTFGAIAPDFTDEAGTTRAGDTPTGEPSETTLIDLDGFLALSTRFNPATYYQEHARVKGAYDRDYEAFQLEGEQTDALNSLLQFTVAQQVPVIFINTPLTDEYLDNHRTQAEEIFLQYMVQVSDRSNAFIFRDFGRIWPQRYDYFSDPSHLNRYGAYQVSARLAQDPLIEWPEPLSEQDLSEQDLSEQDLSEQGLSE